MMKIFILLLLLNIPIIANRAVIQQPTDEQKIVGIWITAKKDAKIKIVQAADSTFIGTIIWAILPDKEYIGSTVLKGVKYNSATGNYTCPWIFSPRLDIKAKALLYVTDSTIKARVEKGIIRSDEWFYRVENSK